MAEHAPAAALDTVAVHLAVSHGLPLFEECGGDCCWRDHDWDLPARVPRTQFDRWRAAQAAYDEMQTEVAAILDFRDSAHWTIPPHRVVRIVNGMAEIYHDEHSGLPVEIRARPWS
jgi:hypothetical protein